MTFSEMGIELAAEIDKSGSDYFTTTEQDYALNQAQDEYTDLCYANFEKDEKMREELNPVVIGPTTFNTTSTINLTAIANFKYMLSVSAKINSTDDFGNTTVVENSVQPRAIDKFEKNLFNSFTKPTVNDPVYQQYTVAGVKTLQVYSDGVTPNSITILYMKIPTVIDITNNPSTSADFSDAVCRKIIQIAARKQLGILENENRVQTENFEIQQNLL